MTEQNNSGTGELTMDERESICLRCFHSYVCEQFNEHRDVKNDKCHFYNDHFVPYAGVAPAQKWISVKDRLPEAGGYVVCIAKRNPFSRFMPMVARIEKNGWVNPITEQYISAVSHWMPIPEPPKEE